MAIVTLTTDFGSGASDVAVLKGALLRQAPAAQIVDVTHEVRKFDIVDAAFHLRKVWAHFPTDTVHLVGVQSVPSTERPHRVMRFRGSFLVAADTGIFALVAGDAPVDAVHEISQDINSSEEAPTFPELDRFVPAAAHLLRGGAMGALGAACAEPVQATANPIRVDADAILGEVIHIDGYGNAVTNITKEAFESARHDRPFILKLRSSRMEIKKLSRTYGDVPVGERLATFNHMGLLEIAMNNHRVPGGNGGADSLLGLRHGTKVRIVFEPEPPATDFFGFG